MQNLLLRVTNKTWDEQTTEMQQGIAAMAIIFNDCLPAIEDPQVHGCSKMGYGAIPIEKRTPWRLDVLRSNSIGPASSVGVLTVVHLEVQKNLY